LVVEEKKGTWDDCRGNVPSYDWEDAISNKV
jgi:hypothetical protein